MAKRDNLEVHDLSDGRYGVFKNGLCIRVFHSHHELSEWWLHVNTARGGIYVDPSIALSRAIRKLG